MPKRAVVAIAATALALVLLFSFKTPDDPGLAGSRGSSVTGVGAPIQAQATAPRGGSTATPAPTSGATDAPDAPAATAAPAAGGLADGTVAGPVVDTRYGPVQVQVTISGGRIADIAALELPSDHPRSAAISDYVAPILRTEALQAQSAQIDLVSGATYTSIAYARSLQAALDQAHG